MTQFTEHIEQVDNRGDFKTIYAEVKRLSGLVSRDVNTSPSAVFEEHGGKNGTAEPRSVEKQEEIVGTQEELAGERAYTRNDKPEELARERGKVTDESTRNSKLEDLDAWGASN